MNSANIISPEEAALAGVTYRNSTDMADLQQKLAAWDYNSKASARAAYSEPSIERLQLLRQIQNILSDGKGFSILYNELEERRGKDARSVAKSTGSKLQPWSGLRSSKILRNFVKANEEFLGGKVDSFKKWYFKKH